MTQVNMLEVKDGLPELVKMLETKQEDVIYLVRNGIAVKPVSKRIGVAEGKFKIPDEFAAWDEEIADMFEGEI